MSWQPEVDEIKRRAALAREMGGAENVERQHRNGRLTIRERIDGLLDADSFRSYQLSAPLLLRRDLHILILSMRYFYTNFASFRFWSFSSGR